MSETRKLTSSLLTNFLPASVMMLKSCPSGSDTDNMTEAGIYYFGTDKQCTGQPSEVSKYGMLVVLPNGNGRIVQIYFPDGLLKVCLRVRVGTEWRDWRIITTTAAAVS